MKRTIRKMDTEEKKSMMKNIADEFLGSMTLEERKELMQQLMPQMMEKIMEGLTMEDRQQLMSSMMPTMMSQMFRAEGEMPSMMRSMMNSENSPKTPATESQEHFKPWDFCPCRNLCTSTA